MQIIIITGMSGSGKSTAVRTLEDEGYYCIDNLPVRLFRRFAELIEKSGENYKGIVLVADIRGRDMLKGYKSVVQKLRANGHKIEILFFDAADDVLIRRFSETRRRHPADENCTVSEGIRIERARLAGLRQMASRVIDSSTFNVHQLREFIQKFVRGTDTKNLFTVEIQSFGFRHGIPMESSLVMDVRFLPNPFFEPDLRPLTGQDQAVRDFILEKPETQAFLSRFIPLVELLIPAYQAEGRAYLVISIGCTGGRHRSVALVEHVAHHLQSLLPTVRITHRDMEKEQ